MKKVLLCFLFSFSLYAKVSPYVAVKPVLGLPAAKSGDNKMGFKTNFGFGLAGGVAVSVNEMFGFKMELEPTYRPSMNAKHSSGNGADFGNLMANGNAVFNVGPVSPYVGFGIGFFKMFKTGKDGDVEFSYQLNTGVEYKVVENFGVALGYRYVNFASDKEEGVKMELYTHDLVVTVSYYF